MEARTALAVESTASTSSHDPRVLFLAGCWRQPGHAFRLRATIRVRADGSADGSVYWRADEVAGRRVDWFGTERVSGSVVGHAVDLSGYEADPGLACDEYRLHLVGDDASGVFGGCRRAFGTWAGRAEGTYAFRRRPA